MVVCNSHISSSINSILEAIPKGAFHHDTERLLGGMGKCAMFIFLKQIFSQVRVVVDGKIIFLEIHQRPL
jgi:hypothetical protein